MTLPATGARYREMHPDLEAPEPSLITVGGPQLTKVQRAALPDLLAEGAASYGLMGEVSTTAPVAEVIRCEFGVGHHPAHVSRILKAVRWTVQKPLRLSTRRKELRCISQQTSFRSALRPLQPTCSTSRR